MGITTDLQRMITKKGDASAAQVVRDDGEPAAPGAGERIEEAVEPDGNTQVLPGILTQLGERFYPKNVSILPGEDLPGHGRQIFVHANELQEFMLQHLPDPAVQNADTPDRTALSDLQYAVGKRLALTVGDDATI